jgi:hypothetical protein
MPIHVASQQKPPKLQLSAETAHSRQPSAVIAITDQITDQSVPTCLQLQCNAHNDISVLADM